MTPIQRVNVDFTAPMLAELDRIAESLNVSRQAVIKSLLRQALDAQVSDKLVNLVRDWLANFKVLNVRRSRLTSHTPCTEACKREPDEKKAQTWSRRIA